MTRDDKVISGSEICWRAAALLWLWRGGLEHLEGEGGPLSPFERLEARNLSASCLGVL